MSARTWTAALAALMTLVVPAAAAADYRSTITSTPGVVGHWPLDEAAGATTVTEVIGNRVATPSRAVTFGLAPGIDAGGTSASLSGSTNISHGNVLTLTGNLSVEAWVAPTTSSGDRHILSKGATNSGYHLLLANGRVPALQVNSTRVTAPALSAGGWHHVVGTLSGRAMAIYVDGRLAGSATLANTAPFASSQALLLGRRSSSSSTSYWQGGLDEVALYNQALDATAVAAHFAAGADISTPAVVFGQTAEAISALSDATLTFAGSKGGLTFTCSFDGAPEAACAGSFTYEALRDGPHSLSVRATDRWGTVGTSVYSWQVTLPAHESAPPVTTFASGPEPLTSQTGATFSLAGSKSRVTFACRLDNGAAGPWAPCSATPVYWNLADGKHMLEVQATDRWGVVETEPAKFTWVVDSTPPDTFALASKATRDVEGLVVLGYEAGARFECRIGEAAWQACPATFAIPELAAAGTFEARAIDPAGNVDPTPASMTLDPVDETAPRTFAGASASFVVAGTRPTAELLCSLDGAAPVACPPGLAFPGLTYGPHRLVVSDRHLPRVAFPAITWTIALPAPLVVGRQFPAVVNLGTRKAQVSTATSRLPRLLFQSNAPGTARLVVRRGKKVVRRFGAKVVQGTNLVILPRAAYRRLRPGRYSLTMIVRNASGSSAPVKLRFDAVRTRR